MIYYLYGRYKKEKQSKDPGAYIQGLKALLDGHVEAAFNKFREVVTADTDNIDAYIRIGDILRTHRKPDKAIQVHKDLTLRHGLSSDEKTAILKALSQDFLATQDYRSALAALKEILAINGNNRWALERILEVHTANEDWDTALETKEKIIKLDGQKSKKGLAIYKFFQGQKLYEKREYHKARLLFKEAINYDTGCVPAYLNTGDSYLAENRLDDAISIWKKMIEAVPDEAHHVVVRLKKALFELGKFSEISTICNEILRSSPKNLAARLTLADYHYKKGEYDLAAEHLNIATEEHPDSYSAILDLAKLYLTMGEKNKLSELIDNLEERREAIEQQYHCTKCGYKSKSKLWFCPSCKSVDSFAI